MRLKGKGGGRLSSHCKILRRPVTPGGWSGWGDSEYGNADVVNGT